VAGVIFGIATYFAFMAGRPLLTLVLNWLSAGLLPLIVFTDPALADVEKDDFYNLQGWVIVDFGYLWFDFVYCAPPELRLIHIAHDGLRLAIAFGGLLLFHIAYTWQSLAGVSLVRWGKRRTE
jgi:hypothetical protein